MSAARACAWVALWAALLAGCGEKESPQADQPFGPKHPQPIAREETAGASPAEPALPQREPTSEGAVPPAAGVAQDATKPPAGAGTQAAPPGPDEAAASRQADPDERLLRWRADAPPPYRLVPERACAIRGVIENPEQCTGVAALARGTGDPRRMKVIPGAYDPKSGRFSIGNLEPGTYDLRVSVRGGHIDGADLHLPSWERVGEAITLEDARAIRGFVDRIGNEINAFADVVRLLAVAGTRRRAKALVEELRYRQFHSGEQGEIVWRVEVWDFTNPGDGWLREQHGWRVLARIRAPSPETSAEDFERLTWLFDPALGGIALKAGEAAVDFTYRVPALTDALGKTPGSLERLAAQDRERRRQREEGP